MALFRTLLKSIKRIAIYATNSGLSAIVDITAFAAILYLIKSILGAGIAIVIAGVVARVLSSILNFTLNKALFLNKGNGDRKCMIRYYILWVNLLILSVSTVYLLHDLLGINEVITKMMADMGLGVFSYQIQLRWVFSNKIKSSEIGLYFRFVRKVARLFIKRKVLIDETVFSSAKVLVGHHQNFYGPISAALWLPGTVHIWVISHLFDYKSCFQMYYNFTFIKKLKIPKILAFPIAGICALLIPPMMKSANAIPVYRESRDIIKTFDKSMDLLKEGHQVLIFPDVKYNDTKNEMGEIYTGFLHLDKIYYKSENEHLDFVPITFEKNTGNIKNGNSIRFSNDKSYAEEKGYISEQIIGEFNL